MTRSEILEQLARMLTHAQDADAGRRLTLTEDAQGWRLGYSLPSYGGLGAFPGAKVQGWAVLDWLTVQGREPCRWVSLDEANAVAQAIRSAVLDAAGWDLAARLEVVVEAQPRPARWTVTVTPTQSGQWRWGVLDPDGVEICGGGGYQDEDEALQDGQAELVAQTARPGAVVV